MSRKPRHSGCGGVLRTTGGGCATCGRCNCPVLLGAAPPPTFAFRVVHRGEQAQLPPGLAPAASPLLLPAHEEPDEDGEMPPRPSAVDALRSAKTAGDLSRLVVLIGSPSPEERSTAVERLRDLQKANRHEAFELALVAGRLGVAPRPASAKSQHALLAADAESASAAAQDRESCL
jgi:hypothetical protein